jgi:hypothetical protein
MQVETQEKSLILRMREDPSLFRSTHMALVQINSPDLKIIQVCSRSNARDFMFSYSGIVGSPRLQENSGKNLLRFENHHLKQFMYR